MKKILRVIEKIDKFNAENLQKEDYYRVDFFKEIKGKN